MQLPQAMALDVSYVGNHGYNLLQNLRGTQAVMDLERRGFRRRVSAAESGSDARGEPGAWRHGTSPGSAPALHGLRGDLRVSTDLPQHVSTRFRRR